MSEPAKARLASAVCYQDARAALQWLEKAFGFEPFMVILDQQGALAHAEMRHGESIVMVASEWTAQHKSPKSIGGLTTQTVHVYLTSELDEHCEHAREAGAVILDAPETQFYGDRTYRCADPEGHIWTFSQTIQEMTPEEWDKASGLTTRTRL